MSEQKAEVDLDFCELKRNIGLLSGNQEKYSISPDKEDDLSGLGGAAYVRGATSYLTVRNSKLIENAANLGGAFYLSSAGTVHLINATVDYNRACTNGGGFQVWQGTVLMEDQTLIGGSNALGKKNLAIDEAGPTFANKQPATSYIFYKLPAPTAHYIPQSTYCSGFAEAACEEARYQDRDQGGKDEQGGIYEDVRIWGDAFGTKLKGSPVSQLPEEFFEGTFPYTCPAGV